MGGGSPRHKNPGLSQRRIASQTKGERAQTRGIPSENKQGPGQVKGKTKDKNLKGLRLRRKPTRTAAEAPDLAEAAQPAGAGLQTTRHPDPCQEVKGPSWQRLAVLHGQINFKRRQETLAANGGAVHKCSGVATCCGQPLRPNADGGEKRCCVAGVRGVTAINCTEQHFQTPMRPELKRQALFDLGRKSAAGIKISTRAPRGGSKRPKGARRGRPACAFSLLRPEADGVGKGNLLEKNAVNNTGLFHLERPTEAANPRPCPQRGGASLSVRPGHGGFMACRAASKIQKVSIPVWTREGFFAGKEKGCGSDGGVFPSPSACPVTRNPEQQNPLPPPLEQACSSSHLIASACTFLASCTWAVRKRRFHVLFHPLHTSPSPARAPPTSLKILVLA
ncbi:hypothetical protein SKAU_G00317250 [Synaphobranchus kaupii]|uniref:Uncharacterized protein n=1 Tax=Synaphobranchus kaupii TaxID=118154 RepID=A0A9Q1IKW9_SYNKA|nr:hypothetical protein SKAU_G00317250 [Synaphobranchus kaupii]